jgi:hypothetical protein
MADELVLRGEESNARLLAEEIANRTELAGVFSVRVVVIDEATDDSFGYGPIAELVVSLTTGVATNAAYDLLRGLISRARDRGELTEQKKAERPSGTGEISASDEERDDHRSEA